MTTDLCLYCNEPLIVKDGRRRHKKYCNDKCRMAGLRMSGNKPKHETMTHFQHRIRDAGRGHEAWLAYRKVRGDDFTKMSEPEAWEIVARQPEFAPQVDMEVEDEILELDEKVKSGSSCSTAQSVSWVADNLSNMRATPGAAPSTTAWSLLQDARESPGNRWEFWKIIWSKLIPTKTELENAARYSEDSSKEIDLADSIRLRLAGDDS